MMCAYLLPESERHGRLYAWSERLFDALVAAYGRTLRLILRYCAAME